jgi:hypothetical protein
MKRVCDGRKERSLRVLRTSGNRKRDGAWWSLAAVSALAYAGPTWAQTRTHLTSPPKPSPAPASPAASTPAPTANSPKPPAGTPKPPSNTQGPPSANPALARGGAVPTMSDGMRGLLIGVDPRGGTITVARTGYPPLTMNVANGAEIIRDGVPARLTDLGSGDQSSVPDAVLVNGGMSAGKATATKIKATSRDHFWYGRLTGIDPANATIVVTRADGQRRAFHLNSRSTIAQFGRNNVPWQAMQVGMPAEVVWIPGENDSDVTLFEAHRVVLNKPYEGLSPRVR